MIADLTTDKGTLPLGSPSSPIISNLILHPVDVALLSAAEQRGLTYTRYADDLTFSGHAPFDVTIEVESALGPHGYTINPDKNQVRKRGQRILVTGLTVAELDRPRLPKQFKRRLRQEVYFVERFGLEGHCSRRYSWPWIADDDEERQVFHSRRHLQGKLHYAMGVEPLWTKRVLASYPVAAATLFPPSDGGADPRQLALVGLAQAIRARPPVPLSQQPRRL